MDLSVYDQAVGPNANKRVYDLKRVSLPVDPKKVSVYTWQLRLGNYG